MNSERGDEKYVKACPKCGSLNIGMDNASFWWFLHISSPRYICLKCKFSTFVFPEVKISELESFRKEFSAD